MIEDKRSLVTKALQYASDSVGRCLALKTGIGLTQEHQNLLKYRGIHSGSRAFVIGNGPSLCLEDLAKLNGEVSFAANKIYLAFDQIAWRPSYYFVEDDLVYAQNYERIEALNCCPKFFPTSALHWGDRIKDGNYFKLSYRRPFSFENSLSGCPVRGFFWGSTVVYSMLQFAVYMGCSPIYLMGVDFSFNVPDSQPKQKALISAGESNHFHADYRQLGEAWNVPNLDYQLNSFSRAFSLSKKMGVEIYNATRGGKLEVFPRVPLDDLLH